MYVKTLDLVEVKQLIEQNHYSRSVRGLKVSFCFGLFDNDALIGALIFGQLSTTAWKKYGETEEDVLELRRMVCVPGAPKNCCSFLIAKAVKYLKRSSKAKVLVSYADPFHRHCGTVYQAANWNYGGKTAPDILLRDPDGKIYHSRAVRTKYKGELKPFAKRLQNLDNVGLLERVPVPGKHIYTFSLVGKHLCSTAALYPKTP